LYKIGCEAWHPHQAGRRESVEGLRLVMVSDVLAWPRRGGDLDCGR
jgi:hypothetical protein